MPVKTRPAKNLPTPEEGEEIVISGMSGKFPSCENAAILKDKLYRKVDMITDGCRWKDGHPEIPPRMGMIPNVQKFDAGFFNLPPKLVTLMDPMCRLLMEQAFQAVLDAGVNPDWLRGKKIAVIVGLCYSDAEKRFLYELTDTAGFGILGATRALFSNRISSFFDINGPSFVVDTACSSSMTAIDHGCRLIRDGECEGALIAGVNLCLHPNVTLLFSQLGVLSSDGRCKTFDEGANGYVRSEAACCVLLQKAKDAKRIYSTIVHTKTNSDGYTEQGITFPSKSLQQELIKSVYEECNVSPHRVSYVECHGTGTAVGDPQELEAIAAIFCKDRKTPLLIGSVKSNFGHCEPASGLCGIVKVLLAMETGVIPANLHLKKPRKLLKEAGLVPVVESTPWDAGYVGLSSFGFGGANAHVLIKSNAKEKVNNGAPADELPRVVCVAGRTAEAVDQTLQEIYNQPLDVEFVALLHNIYSTNIPGYPYRGYTIVGGRKTDTPLKEIQLCDGKRRPIWYCSFGVGLQWIGMGEWLMKFRVFAEAIKKCDAALRPHGMDIYAIIQSRDWSICNDVTNASVGMAAIQVGLTDLLTAVGVVPDHMIGYSGGELGCAYADGCLTAEQTVLAAYYRALAMKESELVPGAMAVVGLGYREMKNLCTHDIDVACCNSSRSSSISGPTESIERLVVKLQRRKIWAKELASNNVAYHSRYTGSARPKLLAYLRKAIPSPRPRSDKWTSTSVPREKWSAPEGRLCSAEYLANNLLNPVSFAQIAEQIPANAIVVEIMPHTVLQECLKHSLKPAAMTVPLTLHGHHDNAEFFLQALGKLHNLGLDLNLAAIYPLVEFPVSRGTPMIGSLVRWDHAKDWSMIGSVQAGMFNAERTLDIYLAHEQFQYMVDHIIDRKCLIPATSYLFFVWETYCKVHSVQQETHSVVFEKVRFQRATTLEGVTFMALNICIHRGDGRFEVTEGGTPIVSGWIRSLNDPAKEKFSRVHLPEVTDEEVLVKKDFYKELKLRGYNYRGLFRGVESCTIAGNKGHLAWTGNWATFMDTMLQMVILAYPYRELMVPTSIRKLVIDVDEHRRVTETLTEENSKIPVFAYKSLNVVIAGGIEIHGIRTTEIARGRQTATAVVEQYKFVPFRDNADTSLHEMTQICVELCCEVKQTTKLKILELVEDSDVTADQLVAPWLMRKVEDLPLTTAESTIFAPPRQFSEADLPANATLADAASLPADGSVHIAVGSELFSRNRVQSIFGLLGALERPGFLFTEESSLGSEVLESMRTLGLQIVYEKRRGGRTLLFLRTRVEAPERTEVVHVDTEEFGWIERVKEHMQESGREAARRTRVVLVSHDPESGIIGFANCARKEPYGEKLRTVLIMDKDAPRFSLENPFYAEQLELDLPVNVLRENAWGAYRHLLLPPLEPRPCFHVLIHQKSRGDLTSLQWVEGPIPHDHPSDMYIRVAYASLNFRDIMLSTGKLSVTTILRTPYDQNVQIGLEYSGIDGKGNRVMGLYSDNSPMSNLDTRTAMFRFGVPDGWSLQEAATVPCIYLTCIGALYLHGNMKKGDKILIHAGSGGIGQAAIHLALAEGCEVFTTVGTAEKRKFIRETFPSIKDDHIGNSRDNSFEQMIARMTNGRGVDLVLNSLAEEKLRASIRCLARHGRFLEIGKYDIGINSELGLYAFRKGIAFHAIMLDALMTFPDDTSRKMCALMEELLGRGRIKPIVGKCYGMDELEDPFRYMASGRHIGKILIKLREEDETFDDPLMGIPRYYCRPDKSYLLVGGLGGFGLELAHWLFTRGARNIVFVSRRGLTNGYQRMRVQVLKDCGVNVAVLSGLDAAERNDCQEILQSAASLAPVDGIFNLAVSLRDSILLNQTRESFAEGVRPKAWITKRLDELSRTLCPELRHFVVFSSISCGKGNPGQTNYGFGNSVMERICERRRTEGLPGLAIQWGAVGEVGLVAEKQEIDEELSIAGTLQQKLSSCFEELDKFLVQDWAVVSSIVVSERRTFENAADSPIDAVMNILGVKSITNINQERTLAELGLDSMMSVEIKQVLERNFDIVLSLEQIRGLSILKLMETSKIDGDKANESGMKTEMFADIQSLLCLLTSKSAEAGDVTSVPTLATDGDTHGFIISGINSDIAAFESFWPKLSFPAKCLRLPLNTTYDTMEKLVDYFMGFVLESMKNRKRFAVIAYSMGGLVSIEIVKRLETLGFSGRLILLDAAPHYLKAVTSGITALSQDKIIGLILFSFSSLNITISQQAMSDLSKMSVMEEKLEMMSELYRTLYPDTDITVFKSMLWILYYRLEIIDGYTLPSSPQLESPVVLLKASEPMVSLPEPDYSVSKFTRGNVHVYTLEGTHRSILENQKISFLINEALNIENQTTKNTAST